VVDVVLADHHLVVDALIIGSRERAVVPTRVLVEHDCAVVHPRVWQPHVDHVLALTLTYWTSRTVVVLIIVIESVVLFGANLPNIAWTCSEVGYVRQWLLRRHALVGGGCFRKFGVNDVAVRFGYGQGIGRFLVTHTYSNIINF